MVLPTAAASILLLTIAAIPHGVRSTYEEELIIIPQLADHLYFHFNFTIKPETQNTGKSNITSLNICLKSTPKGSHFINFRM